jgi:hypothetical protein
LCFITETTSLEVLSKPQIRFKGPRNTERGDGVLKPLLIILQQYGPMAFGGRASCFLKLRKEEDIMAKKKEKKGKKNPAKKTTKKKATAKKKGKKSGKGKKKK